MSRYEDEFLSVQRKVLTDADFYTMKDEDGNPFTALGHPGTLKLACEYEVTTKIVDERVTEDGEYKRWDFTIAVYDKDGNHMETDVGSCDTAEKPQSSNHAIRALAMTRAWMRAVKRALYILERLDTDILPSEKRVGPGKKPQALQPTQDKPAEPASQPPQPAKQTQTPTPTTQSGQDTHTICRCLLADVETPTKVDGVYLCGKCKQPITKTKRIQFKIHSNQ